MFFKTVNQVLVRLWARVTIVRSLDRAGVPRCERKSDRKSCPARGGVQRSHGECSEALEARVVRERAWAARVERMRTRERQIRVCEGTVCDVRHRFLGFCSEDGFCAWWIIRCKTDLRSRA